MGYRLADGVTLENADGTYVFLKDGGDAAVPDHIGGVMIERLLADGLKACSDYMVENYEVEPAEARRDVEGFVEELIGCGLVEEFDA